ncbi:lachesin-like isoform X2 [Ostrea edulis]|uniref:lachesin-like isoform X2 n=1 Tax=Ostrea edulis TaxID=37623 RepID=UPI002094F341|nr:lachesin-like isoform X2 [Ostrea edulis]
MNIMIGLLGLDFFGLVLGVVTHLPAVKETLDPSFDVPITNVTAIVGDTVTLPCSIKELENYKVMWLDHRMKTLTLETRRIIADERITIERPHISDWNLFIHGVELSDAGKYMCQINTVPVKIKYIVLSVHEPPAIIPGMSSPQKVTAKEGETVQLVCNVTGVPAPTVTWYRKSSHSRNHINMEVIGYDGMVLQIRNISRYCDDVYRCVANNGVEPSASREMTVTVQFPPEVRVQNRKIQQKLGKETILDCRVTANPQQNSAWTKNGITIENDEKFEIDLYRDYTNSLTLSLKISDIQNSDYGAYRCEAQNELGRDFQDTYLLELKPMTPAPTTPSTTKRTTTPSNQYIFQWTPRNKPITPRKDYQSKDLVLTLPFEPIQKPQGVNGQPGCVSSVNAISMIGLFATVCMLKR